MDQTNSFTRVYTLEAQTPMIHFQHDQTGAALRASEVKPKLDRYLRSLGAAIDSKWLISDHHDALNYKMRITAAAPHPEAGSITVRDCKAYFGNQGDAAFKGLVFRSCKLEIICFIPELLRFIDENIGSFFVLHNFGTRQSKGFGGFLVKEKTTLRQAEQLLQASCPYCFYADFPIGTDIRGRLNHAMVVYACMKNGFSMGSRVFDGYVTNYYIPEDIGNDQQYIKNCVVKGKPANYDTYEFVRAVLGLADRYDYRRQGVVKVVQFDGTEVKNGQLSIPTQSVAKGLGIKRFPSPIQIKLFGSKMYFLFRDDCKDILGKVFLLMMEQDWRRISGMIDRGQTQQAVSLLQQAKHISTPATFDRDFFMKDFVDYFNYERGKLRSFPRDWKPSAELVLKQGGA